MGEALKWLGTGSVLGVIVGAGLIWFRPDLLPVSTKTVACAADGKLAPPPIVTRGQWKAALPVHEMKRQKNSYITLHHTAVPQNPAKTVEQKLGELQGFSQKTALLASGRKKMPWADVPYHYHVSVAGRIGEGREAGFAGDTNTNYDPVGHIKVVVEGNFEKNEVTAEQRTAPVSLLAWLAQAHKVDPRSIEGHKHFAQTLCPGKNLETAIPSIRMNVVRLVNTPCK